LELGASGFWIGGVEVLEDWWIRIGEWIVAGARWGGGGEVVDGSEWCARCVEDAIRPGGGAVGGFAMERLEVMP